MSICWNWWGVWQCPPFNRINQKSVTIWSLHSKVSISETVCKKTGTMSQILNFEMLCYWEEGDWKEFIQFDRLFVILTVDRSSPSYLSDVICENYSLILIQNTAFVILKEKQHWQSSRWLPVSHLGLSGLVVRHIEGLTFKSIVSNTFRLTVLHLGMPNEGKFHLRG